MSRLIPLAGAIVLLLSGCEVHAPAPHLVSAPRDCVMVTGSRLCQSEADADIGTDPRRNPDIMVHNPSTYGK